MSFLLADPLLLLLLLFFAMAAFLAAYAFRLAKEKERFLERERAAQAAQLNELKIFNKELEISARALAAKDLELSMANKRLASLEKAKSKFISVTTHQLRTPLSAIKWTFEMLLSGQMGEINAEQKEFVSKGYQSTKRMIDIVNDLLSVDQIEAYDTNYHFAPASFEELLSGVVYEFSNQAASKAINVEIMKPSHRLPEVEIDQPKIRIVLENLIDNAIKYTPKNGQVTISVSDAQLNSARSSIEVSVADTGIGVPADERGKLFSKFFRGEAGVRIEPDGSGIGLYISRDIIEKHGGAIWYEEGPSGGSTFRFTLPVYQKQV